MINVSGASFEGASNTAGAFGLPGGFGTADKVNSLTVKLSRPINASWDMTLGMETVDWNFGTGTDPEQKWYTLGLDYSLSSDSDISFLYMISDVDFKGRTTMDPGTFNVYKGGVLGTQVSFRF